jgi:histidine phosphotransfer protein HptB
MVASPDVTPSKRPCDPQTLDTSVLDTYRAAGSAEFVNELIDQFVRDARARVDTMLRSAARGSAHTTKATAHALKGSAAIMGAMRLADLCDQLEQCAAASSPAAPMTALATQVEQELERVCEAIRAQVSTH